MNVESLKEINLDDLESLKSSEDMSKVISLLNYNIKLIKQAFGRLTFGDNFEGFVTEQVVSNSDFTNGAFLDVKKENIRSKNTGCVIIAYSLNDDPFASVNGSLSVQSVDNGETIRYRVSGLPDQKVKVTLFFIGG